MGSMKRVSLKLFAVLAVMMLAAPAPIGIVKTAAARGVGESFAGLAEKALPAGGNNSTHHKNVSEAGPDWPTGAPLEGYLDDVD